MNHKILLVEDERKLADTIQQGLFEHGYQVTIATDGQKGLDYFNGNSFDLILIDLNLPFISGYDLVNMIRNANKHIPIIIITALNNTNHKLKGFDLGADDYLVKPFDFKELLARVNALFRRVEIAANNNNDDKYGRVITIANMVVNRDSKEVSRDSKKITLTTKEFLLLEYFITNPDKVVVREEIAKNVWNINYDPKTNVIDVYVNYLRKKVDKGFLPKLIHTQIGMGYILRTPEE